MAKIHVYLPDEVADGARAAGLNVSMLTRLAVQRELVKRDHRIWLQRVTWERTDLIRHEAIIGAPEATGADT